MRRSSRRRCSERIRETTHRRTCWGSSERVDRHASSAIQRCGQGIDRDSATGCRGPRRSYAVTLIASGIASASSMATTEQNTMFQIMNAITLRGQRGAIVMVVIVLVIAIALVTVIIAVIVMVMIMVVL